MSFTIDSALSIFPNTQVADTIPAIARSFDLLEAEDQLALLWFAYTEMGLAIAPAAMQVVNMAFAERTLTKIKQMSALKQTQAMCDLVNRADTPVSRSYSSFSTNVKLGFWYQLSEWMKDKIVAPIPAGYQLSNEASKVLEDIRQLEGGQQLTVFQNIVTSMGYTATENAIKLKKPLVPPQEALPRQQVTIEGIDSRTVLTYMDAMNAFEFEAAAGLFAKDGALKPPFQKPIAGQDNILAYMREECYGLKLLPQQGFSQPVKGEFLQIKVTGKVQTPWFGDKVGIDLAWRFLLNPGNEIFLVAIDVLASPQELAKMGLVSHNGGLELPE